MYVGIFIENEIRVQHMVETVKKTFLERFATEPLIIRSPGRVNIIGEHTDYNEGFVLPGAINKYIYVAVSKRDDNRIELYAGDFEETYACTVEEVAPTKEVWPNYILGIVDQLKKADSG